MLNRTFFNELTIRLRKPAAEVIAALADHDVLGGVPVSRLEPGDRGVENLVVLAATELTTNEDIAALTGALTEVLA